jgi:hypothetical protein
MPLTVFMDKKAISGAMRVMGLTTKIGMAPILVLHRSAHGVMVISEIITGYGA